MALNYRVILFVREDISTDVSTLISNNDKRKDLLERFTSTSISIKRIAGQRITFTEFKTFYDSVKVDLSDDELILFVDEKASSGESKTNIEGLISHVATRIAASELDVMYFANYLDNCQTTEELTQYDSLPQYEIYKALAPNGIYCLGSTKSRWNTIISSMEGANEIYPASKISALVKAGTYTAGTIWPRLFVPDVSRLTSNEENLHTQPCRLENEFGKIQTNPEALTFYWFMVGFIMLILAVLIVTRFRGGGG